MKTIQALVFAALVAAVLVGVGTHDFECYESAFVSLNRGTAMAAVTVAGQPVYTLALGRGGGMAAAQVLGVFGLLTLGFGSVHRPAHNVA